MIEFKLQSSSVTIIFFLVSCLNTYRSGWARPSTKSNAVSPRLAPFFDLYKKAIKKFVWVKSVSRNTRTWPRMYFRYSTKRQKAREWCIYYVWLKLTNACYIVKCKVYPRQNCMVFIFLCEKSPHANTHP